MTRRVVSKGSVELTSVRTNGSLGKNTTYDCSRILSIGELVYGRRPYIQNRPFATGIVQEGQRLHPFFFIIFSKLSPLHECLPFGSVIIFEQALHHLVRQFEKMQVRILAWT